MTKVWQHRRGGTGQSTGIAPGYGLGGFGLGIYGIGEGQVIFTGDSLIWQLPERLKFFEFHVSKWHDRKEAVAFLEFISEEWQGQAELHDFVSALQSSDWQSQEAKSFVEDLFVRWQSRREQEWGNKPRNKWQESC